MIAVIDYGIGNIKSVVNMLRKVGYDSQITSDPLTLKRADKIILPGVGAFDTGIGLLKKSKLFDALTICVLKEKVPILGICLGAQLFAKFSEEGIREGLGWIDAVVKKFNFSQSEKKLKVPHMGWNNVNAHKKHPIFKGVPEPMRFYFIHSFHFVCHDNSTILATANYGYDFVCGVTQENITGVQFHPEKSHKYGMQVLRNFAELC